MDQVSPYNFITLFAVIVTDLKNGQSFMTITVRTKLDTELQCLLLFLLKSLGLLMWQ